MCGPHINLFLTRPGHFSLIRTQETGVPTMLKDILRSIADDTSGATAVEYGLIISLIVLAIIGSLQAVAGETIEMWQTIQAEGTQAMGDE
jgi:pilus assembly protein Flp/PilA